MLHTFIQVPSPKAPKVIGFLILEKSFFTIHGYRDHICHETSYFYQDWWAEVTHGAENDRALPSLACICTYVGTYESLTNQEIAAR